MSRMSLLFVAAATATVSACATTTAGPTDTAPLRIGPAAANGQQAGGVGPAPPGSYSAYMFDQGTLVDIQNPEGLVFQLAAIDRAMVPACPTNDREFAMTYTRLDSFGARVASMVPPSTPTFTLYKAQMAATGCGAARRLHNAEVLIRSDTGELLLPPVVGIAGETRSLPSFQQDYVPQLIATAGALNPGCKDSSEIHVVDSRVVGPIPLDFYTSQRPSAANTPGATVVESWGEIWTFTACGEIHDVSVLLGAEDRGGLGIIFVGVGPLAAKAS